VDAERIVEGSDVYMECRVQAKPNPYKVSLSEKLMINNTVVYNGA
jgi:hypothetical protein